MHQYTLDRKIEKKTIMLPNVIEKKWKYLKDGKKKKNSGTVGFN